MSLVAPPHAMPIAAAPVEARPRLSGERPLGELSVKPAAASADTRPQAQRGQRRSDPEKHEDPDSGAGAPFLAAVLAGNLPARAGSSGAAYARAGQGWAPPESELRLRDVEA
jgi:hypothetical protein